MNTLVTKTPSDLAECSSTHSAVFLFLNKHSHNKSTHRAYYKELERLTLWAHSIDKDLMDLTLFDINNYSQFVLSPQPYDRWVGPRRHRNHPEWKPFEKPMSPSTRNQTITRINAFYKFCVEAGYLSGNPVAAVPKVYYLKRQGPSEKYITEDDWKKVQLYLSLLDKKPTTPEYERTRFVIEILYHQCIRRSELTINSTIGIRQENGLWWWYLVGKGSKTAKIPFKPASVASMKRYRESLGLSSMPLPGEDKPFVYGLRETSRGVGHETIYQIVKEFFKGVCQWAEDIDKDLAKGLRSVSTHWLRHTGLSHMANRGVSEGAVQGVARHNSERTTKSYYLHKEDEDFYKEVC